jgi:hypothetical protein
MGDSALALPGVRAVVERTWDPAGDQPPVDYDLLAPRAGMPRGEIDLERQRIVCSKDQGPGPCPVDPGGAPGGRGWPVIVYQHDAGEGGGGDPLRAETLTDCRSGW